MGLPSVAITFQNAAAAAVEQGSVGVLALVVKDASQASGVGQALVTVVSEIPAGLSDTNEGHVQRALDGTPKLIKVITIPAAAADYTDAFTYLETISWNVVVFPDISGADVASASTWAKGMRDTKERKILCVLPDSVSDHEAVVNFETDGIVVGETTYTATQYASRIAGIIAGLPLTVAPTYRVLSEVDDVPHLTKSAADALVDAGKVALYHDGEKVKIARGVTSITTLGTKSADWKKIKLVRIYDKIYTDIKATIEDNYIGAVSNSYVNKLLLISAINAYFDVLDQEGILDPGKSFCEIDVDAQRTYLQSQAVDTSALTTQQIKEYNTDDKVYLKTTVVALDAIEDVTLKINI